MSLLGEDVRLRPFFIELLEILHRWRFSDIHSIASNKHEYLEFHVKLKFCRHLNTSDLMRCLSNYLAVDVYQLITGNFEPNLLLSLNKECL